MANIPLKSIKFPGLDDTYTVPQVDADLDTTGAAADAKATGDALTEINDRLGEVDEWLSANDLDGNPMKTNVLLTPYEYPTSGFLNNSIILSNGTIRTDGMLADKGCLLSPLVEVEEGTYGLKTAHSSGGIGNISPQNDGFGLFASDGETPVSKPSARTSLGNDIYLFEVPSGAKYIRFVAVKGTSNDDNLSTTVDYFNQWILLPNADDTIDDSFFVLGTKKEDTSSDHLLREDNSKIYYVDKRIGDLSDLDTTAKTSIVDAINEAAQSGGGGGDGTAEAWMAVNDLDSVTDGKVNVLLTPYTYGVDGFVNNSTIMSDGTIRTDGMLADKGNFVTPLVAVTEGVYGLKVTHQSTIGNISVQNGGFGLFASDGTTPVSKPSARSDLNNDIYLFEVPSTAKYIRFVVTKGTSNDDNLEMAVSKFNQWILLPDADATIDDNFFVLAQKKENGEIDKLRRLDGSYLELVDNAARAQAAKVDDIPLTFGRRTCAIFRKVCCIGDSYTAGYIYNTSGVAQSDNNYSWPEHMKNMTGREYVNCGISGATTASWLTNQDGLAKMQLPANKSQAYIIGLQINDAATELPVGAASDIGTSAQTYYGCTSKIIDEIFTINDDAHVFLLTQPKNYAGIHTPYREAILNIVDWYQNANNGTHQEQVHLIDLLDYYKLFQGAGCNDSMANGHYTAVGWEYVAEILMYAWSNYLNEHPLLFQDVNLIPFGTNT